MSAITTCNITSLPTHGTLYYDVPKSPATIGTPLSLDKTLLTYSHDAEGEVHGGRVNMRVTDDGGGTERQPAPMQQSTSNLPPTTMIRC